MMTLGNSYSHNENLLKMYKFSDQCVDEFVSLFVTDFEKCCITSLNPQWILQLIGAVRMTTNNCKKHYNNILVIHKKISPYILKRSSAITSIIMH